MLLRRTPLAQPSSAPRPRSPLPASIALVVQQPARHGSQIAPAGPVLLPSATPALRQPDRRLRAIAIPNTYSPRSADRHAARHARYATPAAVRQRPRPIDSGVVAASQEVMEISCGCAVLAKLLHQ